VPAPTGLLSATTTGRELLRGNVVLDISNTAARTDTTAADGEVHAYTSGATLILTIFDKDAGAWRTVTLT